MTRFPLALGNGPVKEDVASATGPGMKGDEESMQDTPRPSDEEPSYADALASERERGDDWHPSKPKQKTPGKRYVRRGMAFKPTALERLKPGRTTLRD